MRIGIFGGSFDPIHIGHAMIASFLAQSGHVDEVWLMVSRRNPLKDDAEASESRRLQMAELTAGSLRGVKVSDFEMSLPSPSYTYDTLRALKNAFPDHEFKIIIGSDSFLNFNNWKNAGKIRDEFGVLVYPRPGFPLPSLSPEGFEFIEGMPVCGVSSTFVREKLRQGWNMNYFLPEAVADFISKNKLYQ